MNAGDAAPILGGLGGLAALLAFAAQWVLRPWRARKIADAQERAFLAEIMRDEMRRGLAVLVGTKEDKTQGIREVPGMGARVASMEAEVSAMRAKLHNGINTMLAALQQQVKSQGDKIDEHNEAAAVALTDIHTQLQDVQTDAREAKELAGRVAMVTTTDMQRLTEHVVGLDGKVTALHRRFDEEVLPTKAANEHLRSSLFAALSTHPDENEEGDA